MKKDYLIFSGKSEYCGEGNHDAAGLEDGNAEYVHYVGEIFRIDKDSFYICC